jgi:hypothetical protein
LSVSINWVTAADGRPRMGAEDGNGCKRNERPHSAISDERSGHFTRQWLIECVRPRAGIPQPRSNVCTSDSRRAAAFRWSAAVTRGRGGDQNKINLRPVECRTSSTVLASGDSVKCRNDHSPFFFQHSTGLTKYRRADKLHMERAIWWRFNNGLTSSIYTDATPRNDPFDFRTLTACN